MIVSIGFNTFLSIFPFEAVVLNHAIEQRLIHRHLFLPWKESASFSLSYHFVPRVNSDVIDCESVFRARLEYSLNHCFGVAREKLRKRVIGRENFLVQIRRLRVFVGQEAAHHRI